MSIVISQSAKLYQERMLGRPTHRLPTSRYSMGQSLLRTLPMKTPYPSVEVLRAQTAQPPDAGLTDAWPRGHEELS